MVAGTESEQPERLYRIQNDECHYHTGLLENGRQVLMDEAARLEFNEAGDLLVAFVQKAPEEPSLIVPFRPGTITVKPFFLPELWLGIRDLPDHYQDFVDHPEKANDERFYYPDEIDTWRKSGDFVLWWNEDYFLNAEGEIESS